ncbi:MAG TPA: hypothetical protein PK156_11580 [Polyangium sp.]|nr:hypothetical protein [Polyangium sp.]
MLSSASVIALGCETETDPDTSTTSSSSSSGDVSSSSSSSSSSGAGGSGGGGTMTPVEMYCAAIMTNCTGANAQYPSMDSCLSAAEAFPAGMAADTTGDSLACRAYHSTAAGQDAATHCVHAGPSGGGDMFCGVTCEGFCDIAMAECPTQWPGPDKAACMTACGMIMSNNMKYNTSFTSGNTIECRLYHLSVAAQSATDATTHCPHTAAMSSQCM